MLVFRDSDSGLVPPLASHGSGQNLINPKMQLLAISNKNFLEHRRDAVLSVTSNGHANLKQVM